MNFDLDEMEHLTDEAVAEHNDRIRGLLGHGNDLLQSLRDELADLDERIANAFDQSGDYPNDDETDTSGLLDEQERLNERINRGEEWVHDTEQRLI